MDQLARRADVESRAREALLRESSRHKVTWIWIRGHGASAEQNRCDALAHAASRSLLVLAG